MKPDNDTVWRIDPVPGGGFEAVWGLTNTGKPSEYIDWITDELKPETVVQIFDRTKNNQGLSDA